MFSKIDCKQTAAVQNLQIRLGFPSDVTIAKSIKYNVLERCCNRIDEANTILIASNDGAILKQGSIGFVIVDNNGDRHVTCWGQSSGYDPQSFLSEVYAMLTLVRLIRFYCKYYSTITGATKITKSNFQIITDNESMEKKLVKMKKYPSAPVETILDPHWDVFSILYRKLQWFPN